jgi:PKD repeat protein
MVGYYGANADSEAGNMAFRYQSLTPDFTVPAAGAAQFRISLKASTLQGTAPLNIDFSTQATGGTPAQWLWDFGDGTTSTAMAPSHIYQNAGTYVAKVTITDQRGARNSQSATIVAHAVGNQPPVANAGPDQAIQLGAGVTQTQVALDASGSSDVDGVISYAWAGSPKPNDEVAPSLTLAIGSYEFTLTITDDHGATATDKVVIIVASPDNIPPTASIGSTALTGAAPLVVQFDGSASSDSDGTLVSYQWDFGDGNSASTVAPQHTYSQPGHYTATLTITDDGGAVATASRAIDATLVVAPSADTYVYEFLGNQTPSDSLLVWNHESNHGARILMDFEGLDAQLSTLTAGHFTATLRLYIICDLAAGIGLVQSCPGYPDAGSPGGIATVTTAVYSQLAPWTENGAIAWSGVQEGTQYATFTANATGYWANVDVTTLVEAWRLAGSTGNGIVLTQEAYPVVRDDASFISVLGMRSKESPVTAERPYLEIRINQ